MGSGISGPQAKFAEELYYLLSKEGHGISKQEVLDLIRTVDDVCPFFPLEGSFCLRTWLKVGSMLQGHPRVKTSAMFAWCKVRACLEKLTPANILFAHQEVSIPLPQILTPVMCQPPMPQTTLPLPEKVPLEEKRDCPDAECPPYSPPPKNKPPDPPRLYPELPSNLPTSPFKEPEREETMQPYVSPVTWALQDMGLTTSAFPVIRGVAPAGGGAAPPDRHQPLEYKIIKDLSNSVRDNGPHAPYTRSLLASLSDALMLPHDWKLLVQALLPPADYLLFLQSWRDLAVAHVAANPAGGAVTVDMLTGEGGFTMTTAQFALNNRHLSTLGNLVIRAWGKIPDKGDKAKGAFSTIRQGATETYNDFISRLVGAAERQVENDEARKMLLKQLAYENANEDCKAVLTPIYPDPDTNLTKMLRVCQNVGTQSHTAKIVTAAVMAAQQMNNNNTGGAAKRCFSCGQEGHFKRQCRAGNKQEGRPVKPPSKCPICQKGYHWANQCYFRNQNVQDQGNSNRGLPQAQRK